MSCLEAHDLIGEPEISVHSENDLLSCFQQSPKGIKHVGEK